MLVAFDALVLSEMLGCASKFAKIIHGDEGATLKVKTGSLSSEVRKRIEKIRALVSADSPPDLILNRHCAVCEFQSRCRKKAIETDDVSLLANMSKQERKQYNSKGILTVRQLSFAFRPRRRPKHLREKREKYHHSLKALAIRENRIHIVGRPELKITGTPIFFDVEGVPDRNFHYLIGMRIVKNDCCVQHSFWADAQQEEGKIWREFLQVCAEIKDPVLIHYGGYEAAFLKRMRERFSDHVEVHVKLHGGYYIAWRQRRVSGVRVGSPDQYLQLGTQTPDDFFGCVARLTGYRSRSEPEYLKSQGTIGV